MPIGNETEKAGDWGKTVAMSSDGSMFVVSAPSTSYYNPHYVNHSSWDFFLGLVQAFRLTNETNSSITASTWVPLGQPLLGRYEDDRLGERMALSRNGNRLILSTKIDQPCSISRFQACDIEDGQWDCNDISDIFARFTSRDSGVLALSRDSMMLAVSEAYFSPSAYSEKPYRGLVEIYKWNENRKDYQHVHKLEGGDAFQHFGTTLAFADDEHYTLVVGSLNSYASRFPKGDRLEVFRMSGNELVLALDGMSKVVGMTFH